MVTNGWGLSVYITWHGHAQKAIVLYKFYSSNGIISKEETLKFDPLIGDTESLELSGDCRGTGKGTEVWFLMTKDPLR